MLAIHTMWDTVHYADLNCVCVCVDVYVNLLFSYNNNNYNIYIFSDSTEKEREGWDKEDKEWQGFNKRKEKKRYFFCFIFILCGSGIRGVFERARSVIATLLRFISVPLRVRGPECQVVPQELHDERRVLIAVFIQCVKFRYGIVESLQHKHNFQQEHTTL